MKGEEKYKKLAQQMVALALERVALEAKIEERLEPLPYRYSAEARLLDLRKRLEKLK